MKFGIEEARRLIAENKRTQDPFLDLGNLGLRELPEELWELGHLKRLNLGDKYRDENGKWKNGRRIREKIIRKRYMNRIVEITTGILGLEELESLFLSRNRIKDFSFLQGLNNLRSLDFGFNNIENFSFLQGLSNLRSLSLISFKIKDFSFLLGLSNLTS